jgi:hypothetical protein
MIEQSFPSKRPAPVYQSYKQPLWNSARDVALATARGISVEEFRRRDQVVKALAATVEVQLYGHGFPRNKAEYNKIGEVVVTGITRSYADFARNEEWKDDNPMIVSFYALKDKSKNYFCTASYLVKENLHVQVETC